MPGSPPPPPPDMPSVNDMDALDLDDLFGGGDAGGSSLFDDLEDAFDVGDVVLENLDAPPTAAVDEAALAPAAAAEQPPAVQQPPTATATKGKGKSKAKRKTKSKKKGAAVAPAPAPAVIPPAAPAAAPSGTAKSSKKKGSKQQQASSGAVGVPATAARVETTGGTTTTKKKKKKNEKKSSSSSAQQPVQLPHALAQPGGSMGPGSSPPLVATGAMMHMQPPSAMMPGAPGIPTGAGAAPAPATSKAAERRRSSTQKKERKKKDGAAGSAASRKKQTASQSQQLRAQAQSQQTPFYPGAATPAGTPQSPGRSGSATMQHVPGGFQMWQKQQQQQQQGQQGAPPVSPLQMQQQAALYQKMRQAQAQVQAQAQAQFQGVQSPRSAQQSQMFPGGPTSPVVASARSSSKSKKQSAAASAPPQQAGAPSSSGRLPTTKASAAAAAADRARAMKAITSNYCGLSATDPTFYPFMELPKEVHYPVRKLHKMFPMLDQVFAALNVHDHQQGHGQGSAAAGSSSSPDGGTHKDPISRDLQSLLEKTDTTKAMNVMSAMVSKNRGDFVQELHSLQLMLKRQHELLRLSCGNIQRWCIGNFNERQVEEVYPGYMERRASAARAMQRQQQQQAAASAKVVGSSVEAPGSSAAGGVPGSAAMAKASAAAEPPRADRAAVAAAVPKVPTPPPPAAVTSAAGPKPPVAGPKPSVLGKLRTSDTTVVLKVKVKCPGFKPPTVTVKTGNEKKDPTQQVKRVQVKHLTAHIVPAGQQKKKAASAGTKRKLASPVSSAVVPSTSPPPPPPPPPDLNMKISTAAYQYEQSHKKLHDKLLSRHRQRMDDVDKLVLEHEDVANSITIWRYLQQMYNYLDECYVAGTQSKRQNEADARMIAWDVLKEVWRPELPTSGVYLRGELPVVRLYHEKEGENMQKDKDRTEMVVDGVNSKDEGTDPCSDKAAVSVVPVVSSQGTDRKDEWVGASMRKITVTTAAIKDQVKSPVSSHPGRVPRGSSKRRVPSLFDRLQSLLVEEGSSSESEGDEAKSDDDDTSSTDLEHGDGDDADEDDLLHDLISGSDNNAYYGRKESTGGHVLDVSGLTLDQRTYIQLRAVQLVDRPFLPTSFPIVEEYSAGKVSSDEEDEACSGTSKRHANYEDELGSDLCAKIRTLEAGLSDLHHRNNIQAAHLQQSASTHISQLVREEKRKEEETMLMGRFSQLVQKKKREQKQQQRTAAQQAKASSVKKDEEEDWAP